MQNLSLWQQSLLSSWGEVWSSTLILLPVVIGAVVIFAIGVVISFWTKRLIQQVLKAAGVSKFAQTSGVNDYLKKADLKIKLVDLIATFFEWLIILVFFLAAVDILGLTALSQILSEILSYVPNVLAASFILAAGYFLANIIAAFVRGALVSVDKKAAKTIGQISKWIIVVIAVFTSLSQLKIANEIISILMQGLTYTVVLAVGLSVGLGSKDFVAKLLDDWYKKRQK